MKPIEKLGFNIPKNRKRIFIFLAADYGNLGDVAITYAQHKFLSATFPDHYVTEIPISQTLKGLEYVRRTIKNDDIVTTVGGGNMGDLYEQIENFRQLVFKYFSDNKIISFPQTIDFSESENGNKALETAQKTYQNHKHLLLLAREQKTFDFFQKNFSKNKSLLVPDIVMSLNRVEPTFERKGAVICLREDKEKKLTEKQNKELINIITSSYKKHSYRDTHIGMDFMSLKTRTTELFSIWDDFKKAEIVITDRLHGMIFCFITNTPAIVLLNNNHKVQSSYKWIKSSKNIYLIADYSAKKVENAINKIKNNIEVSSKEDLLKHFSEVKKITLNQL
ncbi:MAG: polysaccharide pyruvyl transferase family protein [Flavobacteriaceae bacterium]|nr:polysaccharide pyruvyl transferase family protein [Flavobacteriaceae bacterium]